jgi:Pentapeptide repeats (8 copies)
MKVIYTIVASLGLLLTSLQSPAQEARPGAPPAPVSAPAPIAITGTSGPLSCAYCDLRGWDLAGKNLTNANLVGSDLRDAKLTGATLDGAILIGANLAGADLSGAHLSATSNGPADLSNANLAGAKLRQAVLTGAQLLFAGLEGADFSGADLTGAALGPQPKVGTRGGRRTSFRGARMDRRSAHAAAAADLHGVIWNEPKPEAAAPAGVTCGNSNISGISDPVYVSSTQGTDSAGCGASPAKACKTLAYSLSRCTSKSCNVLAMFGQFALPTTLVFDNHTTPTGAQLYGGCVASAQPDSGLSSEIVAPPGGVPAISVTGVKPVVLENFKILGSTAAAGHGALAVTVQITQTSQVTFGNSLIVGGQGGAGAGGAAQPVGAQGGNASQQTAGTNESCPNTNGGTGASDMVDNGSYTECDWSCASPGCTGAYGSSGNTSKWASGGTFGNPFATFCPPVTPNDGGGAGTGTNAGCGTGGIASTNLVGGFAGVTWSPGVGGIGTAGGNAGGGGGGGAGGGYCGVCFFARFNYSGSSGGGGGAGGCGGQAGPGGQQGGASFGIVAAAGSILTLNQSRVVAGRSGDGGTGGVGGKGGAAGARAGGAGTSGYGYHGGKGGDGGNGGIGGGGGGGAGGNGGPSAAVALVGGAKVDGTGTYYNGSSGNFGGGGAGGTSPLCPSGLRGNSGVLGSVAEALTYP